MIKGRECVNAYLPSMNGVTCSLTSKVTPLDFSRKRAIEISATGIGHQRIGISFSGRVGGATSKLEIERGSILRRSIRCLIA